MLRTPDVNVSECRALNTMPALDLVNLYMFDVMLKQTIKNRARLERVIDQVNNVTDRLINFCPDVADEIKRLRLEIRLELRGTPVTEPLSSSDLRMNDDQDLTEAQYTAKSLLLKQAYKAVAQIVHPDKDTGDAELFRQANDAYKHRDLDELIYIYVNAVHVRNLYWRNSVDGHEYIATAQAKAQVRMTMLQQSRSFAIVKHYQAGRVQLAKQMMQAYLEERVIELMNELNHVRKQNVQKRQSQQKGREIFVQEKSQSGYCRDGRCPRSESQWQEFRRKEQEIKDRVQAQAAADLGRA